MTIPVLALTLTAAVLTAACDDSTSTKADTNTTDAATAPADATTTVDATSPDVPAPPDTTAKDVAVDSGVMDVKADVAVDSGPNPDTGGWTGPADLEVCALTGTFSLVIDNPYLPFTVGAKLVVEGLEAGTDPGKFEREVLDETLDIGGVTARVVLKTSYEGEDLDEVVEIAREYYAQAADGTVCFFGEESDAYEDEVLVDSGGWLAGDDGALAGIAMPGAPVLGLVFTRVYLPAEEEVSQGEVTAIGEATVTPAGTFDDTLTVLEEGPSIKKYARGVGEIYDDGMELSSHSSP